MLNRVSLVGRITRDLELRKSSNGNPFVAFTIAVNNTYGGNNNVSYVPCFAWNKTAENMVKYLRKGSLVSVDGRLNTRPQMINNQKVTTMDVVAESVAFLDSRGSGTTAGNQMPEFDAPVNVDFDNAFSGPSNPMPNPTNNQASAPKNDGVSFDGDDAILWD